MGAEAHSFLSAHSFNIFAGEELGSADSEVNYWPDVLLGREREKRGRCTGNQFAKPIVIGRRKCPKGNNRFPPLQDGQETRVKFCRIGKAQDGSRKPAPSSQERCITQYLLGTVPKGAKGSTMR